MAGIPTGKSIPRRLPTLPGGGENRAWTVWLLMVLVAGMPGMAWGGNARTFIRLDNYDHTYPVNTTPEGWRYFNFNPFRSLGGGSLFQFARDKDRGQQMIHLRSERRNGFGLGTERPFSLQEWPVVQWEWRITVLPTNGDVRVKERDDQAGSICVVIDPGLIQSDSVLCYLWENLAPKGSRGEMPGNSRNRYIVLRSAKDDTVGRWYKERRDVLADYRALFHRDPKDKAVLALLIDTNDTLSTAEAYYRDIRLEKQLPRMAGR